MNKQSSDMQWKYFLGFGGGLILLLVLQSRVEVSETTHRVLQVGIVFLVYGLLAVWEQKQAIRRFRRESEQRREPKTAQPSIPKSAQPTWRPQQSEKKPAWPERY